MHRLITIYTKSLTCKQAHSSHISHCHLKIINVSLVWDPEEFYGKWKTPFSNHFFSERCLTIAIYHPFLPEENAQHEDSSFLFMQTRSTLYMAPFLLPLPFNDLTNLPFPIYTLLFPITSFNILCWLRFPLC